MREVEGDFETHFTVAPSVESAFLQTAAERFGMKWLLIELARGAIPSQPMLTAIASGRLSAVMAVVQQQAANLAAAGLSVTRVKVEASPHATGIPQTLADASLEPPERYFEQHIKLLLVQDVELGQLEGLAVQHGAHLSRNARRQRADGRQERFVTQRCHGCEQGTARAALQRLLSDLRAASYEILDSEEEYVVYDSNFALDAGWLTTGDAS